MIPEATIAEIRERVDIVGLVGEYVRLTKSGTSFKGLCPFHAEKTPSFYVHPQRRFFHCFGCQASGDVFSFLTRLEGLAFPDAAQRLAERAGVEIPVADPEAESIRLRERKREDRFVQIVDDAAGFFVAQMSAHPGGALATEEYRRRGITDETATSFRLGYAPDEWDALRTHLAAKGWSPADAETVGLLVPRRGSGHYDRFRHRLMFPITDHQGRIVAFSGRALPSDETGDRAPAKYINSPEGPLYTKGEVLFGLHEGRVALRRTGVGLLCEGNFDLLALHQAGFDNAVAPMGTALTERQATLLKRYTGKTVLVFDGDSAGRKAVRAAFPILAKAGLQTAVVVLPPGSDPDSFLSEHGAEAFRTRVDAAPHIVEHLIDQAARETAGDPARKAEAIAELGPILQRVDNPVEVRLYIERVAQKFEVRDIDAVRQQLRRGVRQSRSARDSGRRVTEQGRENSAERPVSPRRQGPPPDPIEMELLGAILDHPSLVRTPEAETFGEVLTDPDLRAILDAISRAVGSRGTLEASELLDDLSNESAENSARQWLEGRLVAQQYEDGSDAERVLKGGLPRLVARAKKREAEELQRRASDARRLGEDALADELTRQRLELLRGALRK